jgi:hypothetical protein
MGQIFEIPQGRIPGPEFDAGQIHTMDVRFFRKALLGPTLLRFPLPNALSVWLGGGRGRRCASLRHAQMVFRSGEWLNKL